VRFARLVVIAFAGLIGLLGASAAGNLAAIRGALLNAGSPLTGPYPADEIGLILATSAVAGAIYAVFLLDRRLPRIVLVGLATLSIGLAVVAQYLVRRDGFAARLDPTAASTSDHWLQAGFRYAVPTVAAAVIAVAVILVALARRPIVLYLTPYAPPPRPSALAGALAIVAGALAWAAAGLGAVALAAAAGTATRDWSGQTVPADRYDFAGVGGLFVAAAVSTVVGGLLYFLALSRRLHWGVPIGIGVSYLTVTVWSFVDILARGGGAGVAPVYPADKLATAAELAAQVPAASAGAVLAVPLLIAGLRRRREDARVVPPIEEDTLVMPNAYA